MSEIQNSKKRKSLSKQVVDTIQDMISSGELKAGDVLPSEQELALKVAVSKSSVREAIKMLEAVGVVEIMRGQGTVLNNDTSKGFMNAILFQLLMQSKDQKQLLEFRKMFEVAYTKLALQNADEEDIISIGQAFDRFKIAVRNGNVTVELDLDFHNCILKATHNTLVISLGTAINSLFEKSIERSIGNYPELALRDHNDIFKAIYNRQIDKIDEIITTSTETWSHSLTK